MLRSEAVSGEKPKLADASPPANKNLALSNSAGLPVPADTASATSRKQQLEVRSFDELYGYVLTQADNDPLEAPMQSAMLVDPSSLEPVRHDCGELEPAVLIDLDPAGGVYDPQTAWHGQPALAEVTAVLRARNVQIVWISGQSISHEAQIRGRLGASGLDPYGKDRVLLLKSKFDSKQQQRRALSGSACVIAIAGDTREDFDELYSYLKTPEAALPLEEMFGAGWFLTPTPID